MLHIHILCIGKIKESYLKDAIREYTKRLSKYCILDILELPDEKIPDKASEKMEETIKEKESTLLLSHLKKDTYCIALDLKGKQYSSLSFSEEIESISLSSQNDITFLIGGSLGMTSTILNQCNELISFSKMTFPHQLIRVFLLEQLFRSFKISHHETYHK